MANSHERGNMLECVQCVERMKNEAPSTTVNLNEDTNKEHKLPTEVSDGTPIQPKRPKERDDLLPYSQQIIDLKAGGSIKCSACGLDLIKTYAPPTKVEAAYLDDGTNKEYKLPTEVSDGTPIKSKKRRKRKKQWPAEKKGVGIAPGLEDEPGFTDKHITPQTEKREKIQDKLRTSNYILQKGEDPGIYKASAFFIFLSFKEDDNVWCKIIGEPLVKLTKEEEEIYHFHGIYIVPKGFQDTLILDIAEDPPDF